MTTPMPQRIAYEDYRDAGGYGTAAAIVNSEEDADEVLAIVGCAAWRKVRDQPGPRLMVVNIGEDTPNADANQLHHRNLERDPHRLFEGVLIAAQLVGCEAIDLYLCDAYSAQQAMLARELAALYANPPCPLPEIELRRGVGSISGRNPTLVQSFDALYGLRDTLEHNPKLAPPC